jgi:glycine C-acetyltransferase/8-amino-7-oxononanoate synthase
MEFLTDELQHLKDNNIYRTLKTIDGIHNSSSKVIIDQKEFILLCSNNYLGLATHPKVISASIEATEKYGTSTGASRLISGTFHLHTHLEKAIAIFKHTEDAIVFSSGYLANIGIISSLMSKNDLIVVDKLNHASIIDGTKLSGAHLRVYPHKDMTYLKKILSTSTKYRRRLIITDGIFSMDGDIAPLPEIVNLAKHYDAMVMVDDAHATGILGDTGSGTAEYFDIIDGVDIHMGTFSKAFGSFGGFIAGKRILIEYLRNKARPFIYSTSLPPSTIAASLAALDIIQSEPERRRRLLNNAEYLRKKLRAAGLDTLESSTQIVPILTKDNYTTMRVSEYLYMHRILAPGIRPPTVPKGKARIRLSLMATHTLQDIDYVVSVLLNIPSRN